MEQNKTGKYLKYAIGEIVLVVIGILIALSINNWNVRRIDGLKEQKILSQLKKEYRSNLMQLEEKILMRNQIIGASSKILKYIDAPDSVIKDSIFHQLQLIMRDPTFDPISNDLISSGNLHIIKNDSLKQLLSNWTSHVYQVQEMELEWQKVRTEIVIPFYIKSGIARDIHNILWKDGFTPVHALDKSINVTHKINSSTKAPELKAILDNIELEGIVSSAITWNLIGNIQSETLKEMINTIIQLIETEMK